MEPEDSEVEVIIIDHQAVLQEEIEVFHKEILREGGWEIEVEEETVPGMIEDIKNIKLIKWREKYYIN